MQSRKSPIKREVDRIIHRRPRCDQSEVLHTVTAEDPGWKAIKLRTSERQELWLTVFLNENRSFFHVQRVGTVWVGVESNRIPEPRNPIFPNAW
jgi:hypothetical protein